MRRRVGDDAGEGSAGGLGCCCCLALLCVVSWACDAPWSLPSVPLGGLHDRGPLLSRCCWLSASSSCMAANGEAVQPAGLTDLLASGRPDGAQELDGTSPPVWAGDGFVGSLTHLSQDRIQGCSSSSAALGRRAGSLASAAWMKLFAPRGIHRSYLEGGREGGRGGEREDRGGDYRGAKRKVRDGQGRAGNITTGGPLALIIHRIVMRMETCRLKVQ